MSAIEDLERKVQSLRAKLQDAEAKLHRARVEAAPVKVGDVVVDHRGEEFRVAEVDPRSYGVHVRGNPRKQDGTWSRAVRHVFDWRHPNKNAGRPRAD